MFNNNAFCNSYFVLTIFGRPVIVFQGSVRRGFNGALFITEPSLFVRPPIYLSLGCLLSSMLYRFLGFIFIILIYTSLTILSGSWVLFWINARQMTIIMNLYLPKQILRFFLSNFTQFKRKNRNMKRKRAHYLRYKIK